MYIHGRREIPCITRRRYGSAKGTTGTADGGGRPLCIPVNRHRAERAPCKYYPSHGTYVRAAYRWRRPYSWRAARTLRGGYGKFAYISCVIFSFVIYYSVAFVFFPARRVCLEITIKKKTPRTAVRVEAAVGTLAASLHKTASDAKYVCTSFTLILLPVMNVTRTITLTTVKIARKHGVRKHGF